MAEAKHHLVAVHDLPVGVQRVEARTMAPRLAAGQSARVMYTL